MSESFKLSFFHIHLSLLRCYALPTHPTYPAIREISRLDQPAYRGRLASLAFLSVLSRHKASLMSPICRRWRLPPTSPQPQLIKNNSWLNFTLLKCICENRSFFPSSNLRFHFSKLLIFPSSHLSFSAV